MHSDMLHHSVLLQEVVEALGPTDGHFYLDATFGNGGYSRALLERADCCVVAIDRDPDAIRRGLAMQQEFAGRFVLVEGCFSDMASLIRNLPAGPEMLRGGAPEKLDGAAFDLGVCSTQLDQADRGFSFRFDGPLDMRMSKSGASAADIVMHSDASDLAQILWEYGEEKASRRIARAIVTARETTPITSTTQLANIIYSVMPSKKPGQIDPATRSFQALRIYVNRELDELAAGLAAVESLLNPDGILAVVSFHSLEDRIVKRFLTKRSQHASRPSRHHPIANDTAPSFDLIARKAILPSTGESRANSRARSAKLRIARRTVAPAYDTMNPESIACG